MTNKSKTSNSPETQKTSLEMIFDDALARFIQTDPKDIADAFEKNKTRAEEIRRDSDERRSRLRNAIKGPGKRNHL